MDISTGTFDRTRDHWWWRPGWGPGARYLTFHLTFEDAPLLHEAATGVSVALGGIASVDPVPREWLHLTMTGLGFAGEVPEKTVEHVAESVFSRASHLATDPLRFDRAFVHDQGLAIAPRSAPRWLEELKRSQTAAVCAARDVSADAPFRPHVSLAYFSGVVDVAAVTAAAKLLPADEIVVARPRLSLIELGRDDRIYTWRVIRQLTLA